MKYFLNKLIIYFLVPAILFILGAYGLFSYLKTEEFGILNLDVRGDRNEIVATRSGDLLAGDKVWGTFHSNFTNLGIFSFRFFNQNRDSDDTLVFRIREVGYEEWYYEAKYETDQFLPHKLFSFGFPLISGSANKDYEFQLESLRGATGNGILIDKITPTFIAKSIYRKDDLLANKNMMRYFIKNKVVNIFGDSQIRYQTLFFFLPVVLYILFLYTEGMGYYLLTAVTLIIILTDLFLLENTYGFVYLSVFFSWALILKRFRFESKISSINAITCLVLLPILLLLNKVSMAEKAVGWAYLFLFITIVQKLYERKFKPKNLLSLNRMIVDIKIKTKLFKLKNYKFINSATTITFSIISLVLVTLTTKLIFSSQYVFKDFYPSDFMERYIFNAVIPVIMILSMLVFIFYKLHKIIKNNSLVLFVPVLIFWTVSRFIISNAIEFQTLPRIISVTPESVTEAWTDIVVIGKNFRDVPFVGKIYIDGVEQGEYLVYWSNELVIFRTSPAITKSGELRLIPLDRLPTNKVPFIYSFK